MTRRIRPGQRLAPNDSYSPFHEQLAGGRSSGMSPGDFDPEQLSKGVQHEMEHTNDPQIATEIAMDHLAEDDAYYDKLDAMERQSFRSNPQVQIGSIRHFSLILTGLLTQYDMAEEKRELKRGGRCNIYRLGHLLKVAQEADDIVASIADHSDAPAIEAYRVALQEHFIYESPSRRAPAEFALSPLRKLDKMMREWVETGKRPKYPVQKPAAHEPNAPAGARFVMQIAKSAAGERGWELTELTEQGPVFLHWSPSSIETRRYAHRLGANDSNLLVEGQSVGSYRMSEGTGAATHAPNASYYVWPLASDGVTPLSGEGPYGPHDLQGAKTYARIAATQGAHNRAVSRGLDPKSPSFQIVRVYEHGTGTRLV